MDALDDHLARIRSASDRDWSDLLEHFTERCQPAQRSELHPIRPGRVPDEQWEGSPEFRALASMLGRCWPTQAAQDQ